MLGNLFKISLRLLWRERFFTLQNIAGLAIGLAAAVFMFVWVQDELTFDRFHTKGDRIYRVLTNWKFGENREWTSASPAPLADESRDVVPGMDKMVRTRNLGAKTFAIGANLVALEKVGLAENGFFDIFDFKFLSGNAQTALAHPDNVVLTETAARKIFGKIPEIGESLRHTEYGYFQVGAILRDFPTNSSIQYDCIFPWTANVGRFFKDPANEIRWGQINGTIWVLLRPDADPADVATRFSAVAGKFRTGDEAFFFALQKVRDIHLHSTFLRWGDPDSRTTIVAVGLIGLMVLLIACINYVNLATARATGRAKGVGIRQMIGAKKRHLFFQSMLESGLTIVAATSLAVVLAWLALPWFEQVGGKKFTPAQIFSSQVAAAFCCTALAAWLASGVQPAFQLSRFKPVTAMKGEVPGDGKVWLRKLLVVGQFVFSIGLGICSLLIYNQLKYVREASLGFDREQTFMISLPDDKALLMKNELANQPGVLGVSACDNPLVDLGCQVSGDEWEGKQAGQSCDLWQLNVDSDFPRLFGFNLTNGRWFRPGDADSLSFVLNETAVKVMNLQNPVGKWIKHNEVRGIIVGVAKDFHFKSLHSAIEPMIFGQNSGWMNIVHVKTNGAEASRAIASSEKLFRSWYPDKVFKYTFLDDQYDQLYKKDARTGKLAELFTILALFISCLGLFGLAAYSAAQRTKEIGIRKVLGASVAGITGLLAKDFLKLVVAAIVISSPLAYFFMDKWLSNFAYHIDIQWWMFAAAGVVAVAVAFLTVGFQSVRAALANPVKSLRSE